MVGVSSMEGWLVAGCLLAGHVQKETVNIAYLSLPRVPADQGQFGQLSMTNDIGHLCPSYRWWD